MAALRLHTVLVAIGTVAAATGLVLSAYGLYLWNTRLDQPCEGVVADDCLRTFSARTSDAARNLAFGAYLFIPGSALLLGSCTARLKRRRERRE